MVARYCPGTTEHLMTVKHGVAFSHLQGWKTVLRLSPSLIETGRASTPIVG